MMIHSHNKIQSRNKKEQTPITHRNMDEFPNIMLSKIRQTQKSNTTQFHLYKYKVQDQAILLRLITLGSMKMTGRWLLGS